MKVARLILLVALLIFTGMVSSLQASAQVAPVADTAVAQDTSKSSGVTGPGSTTVSGILEADLLVLFRILVVATVIERTLEVINLIAPYLWMYLFRLWNWLTVKVFLPLKRKETGPPKRWTGPTLREIVHPKEKVKSRRDILGNQIWLQSFGIILGIFVCWRTHLGIFAQLQGVAEGPPLGNLTDWFVQHAGSWLDYVLTGILVGLGTDPIHSIIKFIIRKRETRKIKVEAALPAGRQVIP